MTRYLVEGRLKPGKKSELAAHLKEGNLARGASYEERLMQGLRTGHATMDDAYFVMDAEEDEVPAVKDALSNYFDIQRMVPENEVPAHELDDLNAYDGLPDWAGVDRD